jgi:hypothetical protein
MGTLKARTPFELSWATWIVIVAVLLAIVAAAVLYMQ